MTASLRDLLRRLRTASDRLKDHLIASGDRNQEQFEDIVAARQEGRREAAAQIARDILAGAPRPHRPADGCGGVARCTVCARADEAWTLAQLARLTGAGQ